jgi:hypothetical protein
MKLLLNIKILDVGGLKISLKMPKLVIGQA